MFPEPTEYKRAFVHGEDKTGWVRIGRLDGAGRRSLWARWITIEGPPSNAYAYEGNDILGIELCSGREGDDAYCSISRDNPEFRPFQFVMEYAIANIEQDWESK